MVDIVLGLLVDNEVVAFIFKGTLPDHLSELGWVRRGAGRRCECIDLWLDFVVMI